MNEVLVWDDGIYRCYWSNIQRTHIFRKIFKG